MHALTSVQISTCDPPVKQNYLSLCCFIENLPSSASVYFSRSIPATPATQLIRIGPQCEPLYWLKNLTSTFSCNRVGLVAKYSLVLDTVISYNNGTVLTCGYYGNSSSVRMDYNWSKRNTFFQIFVDNLLVLSQLACLFMICLTV